MAIASASRVADWRRWPAAMHDPRSPAVRVFAEGNHSEVDFHRWTQFELDAQLAGIAALARSRGMRIGIYQDLATGTSPGGSDTWTHPELFVRGASIGAPPDPYSVVGQNWGLPPLDPHAMARDRMRHWIRLVRHNLAHAGALRIDHVMGLFRSYWIPEGASGKEGAYVRMPWREMLGVLALESTRSDALIVGEDLGTVPPEVPRAMRRWGILSTKVLYFEQDARGFRRATAYPAESIASANTHDLPPIAGYVAGGDVERRASVGAYGSERATRLARRTRTRELASLSRLLRLPRDASVRDVIAAVHGFLGATRARLIALSLDDLMEETLPVNVPGFRADQYPSWRRKTRMTVEALAANPAVDDLARIPL
jgi:4-alpha-glucanotransferase